MPFAFLLHLLNFFLLLQSEPQLFSHLSLPFVLRGIFFILLVSTLTSSPLRFSLPSVVAFLNSFTCLWLRISGRLCCCYSHLSCVCVYILLVCLYSSFSLGNPQLISSGCMVENKRLKGTAVDLGFTASEGEETRLELTMKKKNLHIRVRKKHIRAFLLRLIVSSFSSFLLVLPCKRKCRLKS